MARTASPPVGGHSKQGRATRCPREREQNDNGKRANGDGLGEGAHPGDRQRRVMDASHWTWRQWRRDRVGRRLGASLVGLCLHVELHGADGVACGLAGS